MKFHGKRETWMEIKTRNTVAIRINDEYLRWHFGVKYYIKKKNCRRIFDCTRIHFKWIITWEFAFITFYVTQRVLFSSNRPNRKAYESICHKLVSYVAGVLFVWINGGFFSRKVTNKIKTTNSTCTEGLVIECMAAGQPNEKKNYLNLYVEQYNWDQWN